MSTEIKKLVLRMLDRMGMPVAPSLEKLTASKASFPLEIFGGIKKCKEINE